MEKENKKSIFKEFIPYIAIVIVVVLIRSFVMTPVQVEGNSMVPTLDDNQILILKKYDHSFERFDVVVFDYKGSMLIKRVVGLPGETIEYKDGSLFVNGEVVLEDFGVSSKTEDFKLDDIGYEKIPSGYYFVMGDNRHNSTDSRIIGLVRSEDIQGSTNLSIFPFNTFGKINS